MLALSLSPILIENTIFMINICNLVEGKDPAPPPIAKHRVALLAGFTDVRSLALWPGSRAV